VTGAFDTYDTTQAVLSPGLAWNFSKLAGNNPDSGVATVDFINTYWTGAIDGSWATGGANFAGHFNGTAPQAAVSQLQSFNNVFLSATGASSSASQTLDGDFTINSLSFTPGSSVTLAGGVDPHTLTLSATSSFS